MRSRAGALRADAFIPVVSQDCQRPSPICPGFMRLQYHRPRQCAEAQYPGLPQRPSTTLPRE
eukprot:14056994-Alexandrium_andersonii.AAC.1